MIRMFSTEHSNADVTVTTKCVIRMFSTEHSDADVTIATGD